MPRQSRVPLPEPSATGTDADRGGAGGARPVLLTRPEAQARRFAAQLTDRFGQALVPVISPLMRTRFVVAKLPQGGASALILTSETGALAAEKLQARGVDLPPLAWCVGARTAQAARDAGFATVTGGGDAEALIAMIAAKAPAGPLWHLCGADTRGDVAARLVAAGLDARSIIVYRQEARPLDARGRAVLAQTAAQATPVIVPLFSPRSSALFVSAIRSQAVTHPAPLWLAAISPAAAQGLAELHPERLEIAGQPDAASMLDAVARLLHEDRLDGARLGADQLGGDRMTRMGRT